MSRGHHVTDIPNFMADKPANHRSRKHKFGFRVLFGIGEMKEERDEVCFERELRLLEMPKPNIYDFVFDYEKPPLISMIYDGIYDQTGIDISILFQIKVIIVVN
jgi:hypothetical protein